MLVLRSVCRKFRAIIPELDFWYDAEFLFADLASPESVGSSLRRHYEQQLLQALFSDANIVDSLGRRKTDWMFESIDGLIDVMDSVPLFAQNARTIYLEALDLDEDDLGLGIEPQSLDIAFDTLSACDHVTELTIRLGYTIDLDLIAASFPSLEILNCFETNDYSGSLQELSCLQILRLDGGDNYISNMTTMLPLRAAETLTELRLDCATVDNPIFDSEPLDAFINLKSLNIGPLCDSISDFIIRAKIRLDVFETSLIQEYAPIDKFVNMLQAESLRDIKEFGLTSRHDNTPSRSAIERYWSLVFDAFTSHLLSVEEVQLDAPLNLRCCPYFARMANLKILNWDGSINPYFGCGRSHDPKAMIAKALDKAFANFVEKPQFAVHLILVS
jgi:hypothetical protein